MKKASWIIIGILSTLIGLYPITYFLVDRRFGLLASKSEELLADIFWNLAFYGHIVPAGLALLIGWLQFNGELRQKNIRAHRTIGKAYLVSVLISGLSGLYIAYFATGGMVSVLGFASLAVIWLTTTLLAFKAIKEGKIQQHEKLMIYSYAACFAAVTLRIWLPILTGVMGGFVEGYRIVAWLCWVPNLIVAYFIVKQRTAGKSKTAQAAV